MSAETPCLYCGTEEAISRRKALELLAYLHCGARVIVGDSEGEEMCDNPWPCPAHGGVER